MSRSTRPMLRMAVVAMVLIGASGPVIAGTAASAAPAVGDATAEDLLPDLQVEPLSEFHLQLLDARRIVRFTVSIANLGDGPLEVKGTRSSTATPDMPVVQHVYQRDGTYRSVATEAVLRYAVKDRHSHWHLQKAAEYTLQVPGEPTARAANKEGFCLVDTSAVIPDAPDAYRNCVEGQPEARSVPEGISVGWRDPYPFDVWGQWIDLTGVPLPGRYCVAATADPEGLLLEKDTTNNRASALVDLTSNSVKLVSTGC